MKTLALVSIVLGLATTLATAQTAYYAAGYYAAPQGSHEATQAAAWAAYHAQQQAHAEAWAAYNAQQANAQAWANYYAQQQAAQQAAAQRAAAARPAVAANSQIRYDGRFATVGPTAPQALQFAVYAANTLQNKPYVFGGGHRQIEDSAYDCSSSTSYVLMKAGLLNRCLSSREFANYGAPGVGRFITIWVKPGDHVFMTICGLRMDTSGRQAGEGPRWRTAGRSYAGFTPRHPFGL